MSSRKAMDFRFADSDDAEDIEVMIKEALKDEQEGPNSFRSPVPPFPASQIASDCDSSLTRWIVLETPIPDEVVVAAACIQLSRLATIKFICATGIPAVRLMLLSQLLAKIETVVRGHGITSMVVEIPEWSESSIEWLIGCGFEDKSGYVSADSSFTKKTMILQFQKCMSDTTAVAYQAQETHPPEEEVSSTEILLSAIQSISLEGFDGGIELDDRPPPAMESLFQDIFRALHSENPEPLSDDV